MATEAQGLDHRLNLVANLKLFSAGTSLRNCAPLGNMLTTDSNYKNSHPFLKANLEFFVESITMIAGMSSASTAGESRTCSN